MTETPIKIPRWLSARVYLELCGRTGLGLLLPIISQSVHRNTDEAYPDR